MSLVLPDPLAFAFEAVANARKLLWLADDAVLADGADWIGDLAALVAGTPGQVHFIATTAIDGGFESCGAGLIEYRGSRRYGQCAQPCGEQLWSWPIAGGRCPDCGGAVRENLLTGVGADWVSARFAAQQGALAAWRQRPGGALAIALGTLAGAPQLADLARGAAVYRICCGTAADGLGGDGTIRLALNGGGFVSRLRADLSRRGLLAASPRA